MRRRIYIALILGALGVSLSFYGNCANNTITGNPFTTVLEFAGFQEPANGPASNKPLAAVSIAATVSIKICLSEFRIKYYNPPLFQDYDPNRSSKAVGTGLVQVDPAGTKIGAFAFKNGEYNRIEVVAGIHDECAEFPYGVTMQITNNQGTFYAYRSFQLDFSGQYLITDNGQTFVLPIQAFVDAMAEVDTEIGACLDATCKAPEYLIESRGLGWVSW